VLSTGLNNALALVIVVMVIQKPLLIPSFKASQDIEKGSCIGQKRKWSCSSCGNQGNLKITKCESSQQTSKPALDQGTYDFYL